MRYGASREKRKSISMQKPITMTPMAHDRRELVVLPILGAKRRTLSDKRMVIKAKLSDAVQKAFGSGGTTNPKPAASTAEEAMIAIAIQSQPEKPLLGGPCFVFSVFFVCEFGLTDMAEFFP
jgi:hypothetical protein